MTLPPEPRDEDAAPSMRCARDATRGGLASALNEIADAAGIGIEIEETTLPLRAEVKGVCEILGLDPLYLANEGRQVLRVRVQGAPRQLQGLRPVSPGQALARFPAEDLDLGAAHRGPDAEVVPHHVAEGSDQHQPGDPGADATAGVAAASQGALQRGSTAGRGTGAANVTAGRRLRDRCSG